MTSIRRFVTRKANCRKHTLNNDKISSIAILAAEARKANDAKNSPNIVSVFNEIQSISVIFLSTYLESEGEFEICKNDRELVRIDFLMEEIRKKRSGGCSLSA